MRQAPTILFILHALTIAAALAIATQAGAQSRFSPVVQVGDSVITRYQLDQRTRFLSLLGAPGDPRQLAREQLVNEAVQMTAATEAGIELSADEITSGMNEFASRANLSAEEFTAALQQNGVDAETFRDFIGSGVAWRNYVRARFGDTARDIPQDLVRRTLAATGTEGGSRVLVSEILLPTNTPETAAASRARAERISALESEQEFSIAARRYSIARSADVGGALNWVALDTLPDDVRPIIAGLAPGQISRPVELGNAIGVFLLREVEVVPPGTPESLSVDYALFITDGDQSTAQKIVGEVDICDDLYAIAKGLPAERLVRDVQPMAALPADIRAEIAQLDLHEASTAISRGGKATVLMLCERRPALESTVDFEIIGTRLLNTRLGTMAADHLADLRAGTVIADVAN